MQNVGAIIRNTVFFDCDGVIYPTRFGAPLGAICAHTSSGALDCADIRLCLGKTFEQYMLQIMDNENTRNQVLFVGLDSMDVISNNNDDVNDKMVDLFEFCDSIKDKYNPENRAIILIAGNESRGLPQNVKDKCDLLINIPGCENAFKYQIDSLNVSNAVAVALCHLKRCQKWFNLS